MNSGVNRIFTSYRSVALALIGLVSVLLPVLFNAPTRAAFLWQSPLAAPATPCLSQTADGYTFDFLGYLPTQTAPPA
jgi:hypothetical protein